MGYGSSALTYRVTSASDSRKAVRGATGGTKGINYVGGGGVRTSNSSTPVKSISGKGVRNKLKPLTSREFQSQFKGRQYHKEEAWSHPPSKTGLRLGTGTNLDTSPGGDLAGPIIKGLESGKVKESPRLSDSVIGALKYKKAKKDQFVRMMRKKLKGTHASKGSMSQAYKEWRAKGGQHKDEKKKSHSKALGRVITGLQSRNKQTNTYSMGF